MHTEDDREARLARSLALSAQVSAAIDSGEIVLPDPGRGAAWSILDSGSSRTAANHKKHFPGADLQDNEGRSNSYASATCELFSRTGKSGVDFKTENHHDRSVTFENANVATPIVSMHKWHRQGQRTTLEAETGNTYHVAKDEDDPLIVRSGVYFLNMHVDKYLLNGNGGVGRPGKR